MSVVILYREKQKQKNNNKQTWDLKTFQIKNSKKT